MTSSPSARRPRPMAAERSAANTINFSRRESKWGETSWWGRMPFFFSSRGRHTRWTGDWSSDVCSSDLRHQTVRGDRAGRHGLAPKHAEGQRKDLVPIAVQVERHRADHDAAPVGRIDLLPVVHAAVDGAIEPVAHDGGVGRSPRRLECVLHRERGRVVHRPDEELDGWARGQELPEQRAHLRRVAVRVERGDAHAGAVAPEPLLDAPRPLRYAIPVRGQRADEHALDDLTAPGPRGEPPEGVPGDATRL